MYQGLIFADSVNKSGSYMEDELSCSLFRETKHKSHLKSSSIFFHKCLIHKRK